MEHLGLILSALGVVLISVLWRVLVYLAWRPYALTKAFESQGIRGPAYKFWSGSIDEMKSLSKAAREKILDTGSHDITTRVMPHHRKWIEEYGETVVFWFGPRPRLCISDPEMVKQVLANKFGFYTKINPGPNILALLGRGLVLAEGSEWARHRRVVSPAFAMDKLKMLTRTMTECAKMMLEGWQAQVSQAEDLQKEIEVAVQFQELTADVISQTAFGSSYKEGKEVFLIQKELQILVAENIFSIDFPGSKFIPTKRNIDRWNLEKRVRNKLMGIIEGRLNSKDDGYGNDLLGLMMEASEKQDGYMMSVDEIIDECKTFFFAGHETTSHLLTWTMFLLSSNQNWQEKLREEVLRECGMDIPNADALSKLKMVNMVLLETLRLYGPVVLIGRQATKDMTLGNISISKGTQLIIPIAVIHRSKKLWGDDANEFNPLRFENGITMAAKHPNALLSFSIGPRACIGQNFAMLEAKAALAMILQRFSFSLSPKYKHAPAALITLQPAYGLPIVFSPFHALHI